MNYESFSNPMQNHSGIQHDAMNAYQQGMAYIAANPLPEYNGRGFGYSEQSAAQPTGFGASEQAVYQTEAKQAPKKRTLFGRGKPALFGAVEEPAPTGFSQWSQEQPQPQGFGQNTAPVAYNQDYEWATSGNGAGSSVNSYEGTYSQPQGFGQNTAPVAYNQDYDWATSGNGAGSSVNSYEGTYSQPQGFGQNTAPASPGNYGWPPASNNTEAIAPTYNTPKKSGGLFNKLRGGAEKVATNPTAQGIGEAALRGAGAAGVELAGSYGITVNENGVSVDKRKVVTGVVRTIANPMRAAKQVRQAGNAARIAGQQAGMQAAVSAYNQNGYVQEARSNGWPV